MLAYDVAAGEETVILTKEELWEKISPGKVEEDFLKSEKKHETELEKENIEEKK